MTIVDPMIGRAIAQYEILARRGGGGMGVVYEARDTKLGRRVALKFLPPQWSHDEAAKQRFVREAQAASATHHPNICTIHDVATTEDGRLFIVMAFYEGETLKERLARGALPLDEALDIATQVADGLARAHANGVVHRDIKPGNLILTEDGVRIIDFGLATFADALQLTVPGSTLGTAAYMSPEQARGEDADARSDVWSAGVVLYEMLTGHVPFRGAYAEAIAYAIRNDPPAPPSAERPDVPEDIERVVFRALHKDPAIRYQNGRELARALRQGRGFSVPPDLRTQPISVPAAAHDSLPARLRLRREWVAAVLVVVLAILAGAWWTNRPVQRISVAVAPVSNQTGDDALDAYRLGLTHMLMTELADSPNVRVLAYPRLVQLLGKFLQERVDITSRDVVQALASNTDAAVLIVPTLLYDEGRWYGRAEFRNPVTRQNVAVRETTRMESPLAKQVAGELVAALAASIQQYFRENGPGEAYDLRPAGTRLSVDGAKALEEGLREMDGLEFAAARKAFAAAAEQDPRHPLPLAWSSRAALLMLQPDAAAAAADAAARLVTDQIPERERLFVAAVVAEARQNFKDAEARLRDLVERYPDETQWVLELGGFLDRRGRAAEAVTAYHDVLARDEAEIRPRLELCRLYNSTRTLDPASAKEHGGRAATMYREIGSRRGEAQALLCLTDVLRVGSADELAQARLNAEAALGAFRETGATYNVARAHHYVALAAEAAGDLQGALTSWEAALAAAREVGNADLEVRALGNLGVTAERLGRPLQAIEYHRASFARNESLGNERIAAYNLANAAALHIRHRTDTARAVRDVRTALAVFDRLGDRNFEVFGRQVLATHLAATGKLDEAERELNVALGIARERNLVDAVRSVTTDLARIRFARGDYARGWTMLSDAGAGEDETRDAETEIVLARFEVRMGDFAAARQRLGAAADRIVREAENRLLPLLELVNGELEYEAGRPGEARVRFARAAALWDDAMPHPASVEARAWLGLLEARGDAADGGRTHVAASVAQAARMQDVTLEARCRLLLARLEVEGRRPNEALDAIRAVPDAIQPEMAAQVHYWRGQALALVGDRAAAESELALARQRLADGAVHVPEQHRAAFTSRPDLRLISG